MTASSRIAFLKKVVDQMPEDWLKLTTHRLDIYEEKLAKTQFLDHFEDLFKANKAETAALSQLPTAYDYIRLGHPLSCVLEWAIAHRHNRKAECVISFSSQTMPILAILRKNLFDQKKTRILFKGEVPDFFDADVLRRVYGYQLEVEQVEEGAELAAFEGSTILVSERGQIWDFDLSPNIDFYVNVHPQWGSVLMVSGPEQPSYISEIQHVRRRESIAMTPSDCRAALLALVGGASDQQPKHSTAAGTKAQVLSSIREVTQSSTKALVGSSGLSVQYAIMMGLIDHALDHYPGKAVKFIVPPNCYGGTNDQARRVAACIDHVEVVDLPVDGDNDMVQSIDTVLTKVAAEDAVPFIIAEIPTNPRVEVPDLTQLQTALSKQRKTAGGDVAIDPVFILDQTFCPNVPFLGEGGILSSVRAISYVSGSKFPSGGLCTAGYCVGNTLTEALMDKVELHLRLCDNEATDHQMDILARQLPSMKERIEAAYQNTREFVHFIQEHLSTAKINFVSEALAAEGFTPSVFSLDLPTRGDSHEEREAYKRALNLQLINRMIGAIPDESKYCVSYGQLKGCYWTIPATSTQGTTKEGDKDYIVRVSLSPDLNLELHKQVFLEFVGSNTLNA